jgi:hypothetical protein
VKYIKALTRYIRLIPEAYRISKLLRPRPPAENHDMYLWLPPTNSIPDHRGPALDYMKPTNATALRGYVTPSPRTIAYIQSILGRSVAIEAFDLNGPDETAAAQRRLQMRLSFMSTRQRLWELTRMKFCRYILRRR